VYYFNTDKAQYAGGHLSDPENRGQRQRGVNFDTLGSWNNRIHLPVNIKKSIEKGKLIPDIPLGTYLPHVVSINFWQFKKAMHFLIFWR